MSQAKFNLVDHTTNILKLYDANQSMTIEVAVQCFIANLTTMKEHYPGCPDINFHELGQQWNRLLSREKVAQKAETLARMKKYSRSGGKS